MANISTPKGTPPKIDLSMSQLQANWSYSGLTMPTTVYCYDINGKCTVTHTPPSRGVEGPLPMLYTPMDNAWRV